MEIKKILVAIDGSDMQELVLDAVRGLGQHYPEAEIELFTVVSPRMTTASDSGSMIAEMTGIYFERANTMLAQAAESLGDVPATITTEARGGIDPADTIIEASDGFDLVVIGNRGLSGMREYIGSVSHKVLHKVACPILLVK